MSKALPLSVAVLLTGLALVPVACSKHNDSAEKPAKSSDPMAILSYAQGYQAGAQIPAELSIDQLANGMRDSQAHKDPIYSEAEIKKAAEQYQKTLQEKAANQGKSNEKFLADNAKKPEIKTTASGLQYQILKEGTGKTPTAQSTVKVNYEGKLVDGTVFDSSFARKEPVELPLGSTIPGWIEGLPLIKEGGSMMLYVPAKLGYGEQSVGSIPANSVLIFKIELISVK
ncbi:FKBP-type peptidyl-prolyl cis-trans isomerase [Acinetobacter sp. HY1485]|uniref:FKBP-type peptidyl-prolyl cis-trans isomerase n=1 Tax=Acinetobacter sp. HY1485 TaxID=2970918 RepID=UPI0022B98BC5|nr:FKBP-type peptidyl-prolyl cis-trans isomerase [Acinetobacter sp. HY1485]